MAEQQKPNSGKTQNASKNQRVEELKPKSVTPDQANKIKGGAAKKAKDL